MVYRFNYNCSDTFISTLTIPQYNDPSQFRGNAFRRNTRQYTHGTRWYNCRYGLLPRESWGYNTLKSTYLLVSVLHRSQEVFIDLLRLELFNLPWKEEEITDALV